MNKNQLAYQSGKILINQKYLIAITGVCMFDFYESVNKLLEEPSLIYIENCFFSVAIALYSTYLLGKSYSPNKSLKENIKKTQVKEKFPLQHCDEIIFEDINGLEKLLEKTAYNEKKEWGTFFKTKHDGEKAIIDSILDIDLARKLGLVDKERRDSIHYHPNKAASFGYRDFIHYHPTLLNKFKWIEAVNYNVSVIDRHAFYNRIGLITFNMPEGPEIIGYNLRHTYIPASKKDKSRLIKADSKTIREYLKN